MLVQVEQAVEEQVRVEVLAVVQELESVEDLVVLVEEQVQVLLLVEVEAVGSVEV